MCSTNLLVKIYHTNCVVKGREWVKQWVHLRDVIYERSISFQCLVFYNNVWNSDLCKTSSITMAANSATAYVNCDCSVTGYVAVGLVDSQNQVTYLQEVYKFRQKVQIT